MNKLSPPGRSPSQRTVRISVGGCGLVIAIAALSPAGWGDAVAGWANFVSANLALFGSAIVSLCVGVAGGLLIQRRGNARFAIQIVEGADYARLFRERIESGGFAVIKVFGYTGETVLNDLLRFDDRYNAELEVRLLHRNWLEEAANEAAHNSASDAHPRRPWDKARAIRSTALAEWPHAMIRRLRYYDGPPCIKGVLLCAARDGPREAFVTFFEWIEWPDGGGSRFKASGMSTMYISGAERGQQDIIRYLESQFDLKWAGSRSCADLLAEEERRAAVETKDGG